MYNPVVGATKLVESKVLYDHGFNVLKVTSPNCNFKCIYTHWTQTMGWCGFAEGGRERSGLEEVNGKKRGPTSM